MFLDQFFIEDVKLKRKKMVGHRPEKYEKD